MTGAAGGLGQALAAAFRARGDDVLTSDLSGRGADLDLDVTSEGQWQRARAHVERTWGGLDVLVNNAGVAGGGRVDVDRIEEWQRLIDINLLGVVRGTKTFVPLMKTARSGQIVNIASLAGLVHPAGMGSYNASKAAVVAFTETIGFELAAHSITAHVVCPGYFRTGLIESAHGDDHALGQVVGQLIAASPHGPDDIARAILAGLAAGDPVILPDEAAQQAWQLKRSDPTAYRAVMLRQADGLARFASQIDQQPQAQAQVDG